MKHFVLISVFILVSSCSPDPDLPTDTRATTPDASAISVTVTCDSTQATIDYHY